MATKPYIVGLTGGIGSGKSAVSDHFARLGIAVVDTDQIAHALTAPGGAAMPAIEATFGPQMVTAAGALDRTAMRELVFSNASARQQLEGILHPLIRELSERACREANSAYVILAVPLLIEAGNYAERVNRICVVDCSEAQQIERVRMRNGFDEARIRSILAAQASRAERLAAADDVIDNSGSLADTQLQVEALHQRYLQLAAQR